MSETKAAQAEVSEAFDVSVERIAQTYAEALYNSAQKRGQLDQVLAEMDSLVKDVFPADPRVQMIFSSQALSRDVRKDAVNKVFKDRASESFTNFLQVLNAHDRLEMIGPIARSLAELHDERTRHLRVYVTSAVALASDQRETIINAVRERFQLEPILLEAVDPVVLGGLKLRIGDRQFDGTVRTRIETLRNKILARSSHEIQSRRDRFCS